MLQMISRIIYNTLQKDPSNSGNGSGRTHLSSRYEMRSHQMRKQRVELSIRLFFSDKRYDLGEVGRYRINKKLEPRHRHGITES